jgi:hypothetical protein
MESENVLVITDGDDGLEHKNARPGYNSVLCAEVSVFPQDAVILFVTADNIGQFDRLAFRIVVPCVEVLDSPWVMQRQCTVSI